MKTAALLSSKKMGLDRRVWIVMIVTCILCIGLFSYRLINTNEPCAIVTITINSIKAEKESTHFTDEPLIFKIPLAANKKIEWDFGDKTKVENGFIVTHTFKQEGNFIITSTINGRCKNIARVAIKKRAEVMQGPNNYNISEKIVGNTIANVGKDEQFYYNGTANSYEWTVKNSSNYATQNSASANFKFTLPGPYTIQLVLNNDPTKKGYKEITVIDPSGASTLPKTQSKNIPVLIPQDLPSLPPAFEKQIPKGGDKQAEKQAEKQPEKQPEVAVQEAAPAKKILLIRNETFKTLLEGVVTGSTDIEDFDKYLFYGGKTPVRANDDKNFKTFTQFCNEIRGKKISIESVELKREENESVQQIKVKYSKKGFLRNIL